MRAWLRVVTLALGIAFLGVVIWVTTQSTITRRTDYGRVSAVMLYPLSLPMAFDAGGTRCSWRSAWP